MGRNPYVLREDPTWVSQTFFAKLCGVSRTAIVSRVREGALRVSRTGMIDLDSPEAQDYLAAHRGPPDPTLQVPRKRAAAPPLVVPVPTLPAAPQAVPPKRKAPRADVPADTATAPTGRYRGTSAVPGVGASPRDLQAWKLREEVVKLQLANARELRQTVGRELVERMIGVIDTALNRIIMDGRSNLIPQMVTMVRAGAAVEDIQRWWADECGKFIGPVKPHLKKLLANDDRQRN